MSATTSENSGLHDYLVTGETLFVTGAVLAFVSDIALTFRSLVLPNFVGLTFGLIFILGTLYMINWLYTGKKEARTPAAIWAGLQIAVALVGTVLLLNQAFRWDWRFYRIAEVLPQSLSVASYLLGAFKVFAYGVFLYLITQPGPALFFLRHRGGETVEAPSPTTPPEDIHPTGAVLPLTAEQADTAETLAGRLNAAGIALMIAAFFVAVTGGQLLAARSHTGWINIGEGVALFVLGLLALGPVASLRNIKDRGTDTAYIADTLCKLTALLGKQIVVALALLVLTGCGILVLMLTIKG